jgi:hypothetical protein
VLGRLGAEPCGSAPTHAGVTATTTTAVAAPMTHGHGCSPNHGGQIERALRSIIDEAVAKKAPLVEIIPGKGSGQLKKRVLRFLDRKDIKTLYHRVEKDSDNFGRVFVHFRWK